MAGEWAGFRLAAVSWDAVAAMFYVIVVGSILSFGAFTWLNRTVSSTLANTFTYVAPVIALGLGALFLGEALTAAKAGAAAVALVGVALMAVGAGNERATGSPSPDLNPDRP